ncbi:thiamine diphosphokinase [Paenibacillus sp. CAA11]|uniref:thiamine diphosphokinase n=1 Tax=Paenibacillus sp. CAA11 TaxID=1532905 RepID=UPI000D378B6C|nr:thiamine diphosphokinase [Paenibacillus sp. CAA11]AWB44848.1 thiamine diphosphokinase [Paenibacillus sp. CAA11]
MRPSSRVLIFSGGSNHADQLKHIQQGDFIIGADRGALFLVEHGIVPDMAVGDFDSVTMEELEKVKETGRKLVTCDPVDKNLTDTELAFEVAMDQQPEEILLFGVLGSRFDHSFINIQLLIRAMQHQVSCAILDQNNYITLTGSTCTVHDRGFSYVSLLPITAEVTGITLSGFMYPLDKATLKMGQSRGISNKLLGEEGTVQIESGLLLVIQSKD